MQRDLQEEVESLEYTLTHSAPQGSRRERYSLEEEGCRHGRLGETFEVEFTKPQSRLPRPSSAHRSRAHALRIDLEQVARGIAAMSAPDASQNRPARKHRPTAAELSGQNPCFDFICILTRTCQAAFEHCESIVLS
ncbi:unnamed protein product [Cladocopium goreaui]|uniref:Uncharacterized protein n=1 Tax=Cladocopium goreaui TaxID=2562237 RepID=A0A9P1C4A0_9DINO|nr:unnamed protein product [Cladocopium goreaui]